MNEPKYPTLLIARHGETDFNRNRIFQGRTDNPLNETGLKQAEIIGELIRKFEITTAYVSPLQRAVKTGEIALKGREIPLISDKRLIEINFGEWEGVLEDIVKEKFADEYLAYRRDMSQFFPSGGESAREAWERSGGWWDEVKSKYGAGDTLIVFAHQSINACLGCYVSGVDLKYAWENFKCAPGEVIKIVPGRIPQVSKLIWDG